MKKHFRIISPKFIIFSFLFFSSSNGQFLDDIVHNVLINNNYQRIDVIYEDIDKILLKGRVDTYYDKLRLYETVVRIPGVREVSNHVIVDNPSVPDDLIEHNIQEGIIYIPGISNPQDIQVEVKKGIVYLNGRVSYIDEKNTAYKIASLHEGVRGIVNKIEVTPVSKTFFNMNLKNFLEGIIRERYPDEDGINVIVENGEVEFEGTVSSTEIKEEITGNISEMQGVTKVINNLEIKSGHDSEKQ